MASVRYEHGSNAIPLMRVKETAAGSATKGPATIKTIFVEVVDGQELANTCQPHKVGRLVI